VIGVLRPAILAASRSGLLKRTMLKTPVGRKISTRFVAGEDTASAVTVARQLAWQGLDVSLDFLGEDTTDRSQACATVDAYRALAAYLAADGLAPRADLSVKLTALGLDIDPALALDNAQQIVDVARAVGATVTIDLEGHTRTDATLHAGGSRRCTPPATPDVHDDAISASRARPGGLVVPTGCQARPSPSPGRGGNLCWPEPARLLPCC